MHILYGKNTADNPERVEEIQKLAQFLKRRSTDPAAWSQSVIVLGDFNIFSRSDITMKALTEEGFLVPEELQAIPGSNVPKNKYYDQFRVCEGILNTTGKAGIFDLYEVVYKDEDEALYVDSMGESYRVTSEGNPREDPSRYYRTYWRTHQISDHLPMWIELEINQTDPFLTKLLERAERNLDDRR